SHPSRVRGLKPELACRSSCSDRNFNVHQKLVIEAAEKGVSMNRLVSAKLAM
ncbi:MAG: toxin-antitoxin system HicB family antitoxin, partial [Candidimonas sp.]